MDDEARALSLLAPVTTGARVAVRDPAPLRTSAWLYDFAVDVLHKDKFDPQPHQDMCGVLEEAVGDCSFRERKGRRGLLMLAPRGSYKTTGAGEALPLGVIARNHDARILVTAHNIELARARLRAIKNHLTNNADFKAAYPADWVPAPRTATWSASAIEVACRRETFREATVEVAAAGADRTGSHYNLIICDDVVQPANVRTYAQREKIFEYIDSLFSLLDPGGTLILIGTRWHPDDAYGRILTRDAERIKRGEEPYFQTYIRSCYDGPGGLYFPAEYDHAELALIRGRGERVFAANYLNQPVADSDRVFAPKFRQMVPFEYVSTDARLGRGVVTYGEGQSPVEVTMVWDTAGAQNTRAGADYHGITVVGTDPGDRWWILAAEELRGTASTVVGRIAALYMAHRPTCIAIESSNAYDLWRQELVTVLSRYNVIPTCVVARHHGVPKAERIAMMEPRWSQKRIVLREGQYALDSQLTDFSMEGSLAHDDLIDSLAHHEGLTQAAPEVELPDPINDLDPEMKGRYRHQRRRHFWR